MSPLWIFALAVIAYALGACDGNRTSRNGGAVYRNGPPPPTRPPGQSPPPACRPGCKETYERDPPATILCQRRNTLSRRPYDQNPP